MLSRRAAGTPLATRPSTWSFISAMSGETTSATPGSSPIRAGTWKQSDLPPPVGSTTTLSRRSSTAWIAEPCRGRSVSNPQ